MKILIEIDGSQNAASWVAEIIEQSLDDVDRKNATVTILER